MPPMMKPLRILEISIPHITPAGTFHAALDLPDEIVAAGFNTVFVLPWMEVNTALSRSPYACTNHVALNETLGTLDDAHRWLNRCHQAGLRVVLDMPLNHTSPNHMWVENDGWYSTDVRGLKHSPRGTTWNDVVQLNHGNRAVVESCAEVLRFWMECGVDGFRFDAASFIPDAVLQSWIVEAQERVNHDLLVWCDGRAYQNHRPFFNGYIYHEANTIARRNGIEWERLVNSILEGAIFYLTNHDTLHAGKSPNEEWPGSYERMRQVIQHTPNHVLFSWNDWQDPSSCYSFMLMQ
jgi:glycosidase